MGASLSAFQSFLLLIVTGLVAIRLFRHIRHTCSLNHLPGPPTPSFLWGHSADIRAAPVETRYNVFVRQYGNTYRLFGPLMEPILALGDPKAISYILNNPSKYTRPEADNYILRLMFGPSVISADGDEHKKMRRQLNPAFTLQSVQDVSHVFYDLTHRLIATWEKTMGENVTAIIDVSHALHTFSMDAISMTMFAYNLSASSGPLPALLKSTANGPDMESLSARLAALLVDKFPQILALPNPMKKWSDRLRGELGKVAQAVWDENRENTGMEAKAIDALKETKTGEYVSERDAVPQIVALLFAGSETVATMMGEFLYEMALQPDIQDKARSELIAFERTYGHAPDYQDLVRSNDDSLRYFDAVARETMRCKAVIMNLDRTAVDDDVIPLSTPIQGTDVTQLKVQAGTLISMPIRDGVHRDPEIWGDDAEKFRPERWLDEGGLPEGVKGIHALGNLLTFGDGPRICLGRVFAIAEFKIVASTLLRHFAFESEGSPLDFYHMSNNIVKPKIRGEETKGVILPLRVRRI